MPITSDRRSQLAHYGQAAAWQAADLEEKFIHVWRFSARNHADGGDAFLWGVVVEVINLRRFAAWAARASA